MDLTDFLLALRNANDFEEINQYKKEIIELMTRLKIRLKIMIEK